jgi:ABC-type antimicrobial peptide transport system permease subunit
MNSEQEQIERAVIVLNVKLFGILLGFLFGSLLFLATNFLILKGGENVGAHLALLSVFFPGYRVTFVGSIIGFLYMFLLGCIVGIVIGLVYNKIAKASAYNPARYSR